MTEQDVLRAIQGVEGQISGREALLLWTLAKRVADGVILEVGSWRGRSAVALGMGSRAGAGVPVYAVDPHAPFRGALGGVFGPEDRVQFLRNVLAAGVADVVHPIALPSVEAAAAWRRPLSLLFVDGDHTLEGVRADVAAWLPHVRPGGAVAFHDAVDPALGPVHVVAELLAGDAWRRVGGLDTTVVVQRVGGLV